MPANVREALTIIPAEDVHTVLETALCEKPTPSSRQKKRSIPNDDRKTRGFYHVDEGLWRFHHEGLSGGGFAGKSNVGKSSMINKLTNRNKLARTSATPGKTRLINVYQINNEINFIDLPGYGFAKVSKDEKASWGKMMQDYFARTEDLPCLSSGGYPSRAERGG